MPPKSDYPKEPCIHFQLQRYFCSLFSDSCPRCTFIWIFALKFKSWMNLPKCSWRQCSSSPGDLTRLSARFQDSLDTKCTKSVIELAYYDALKNVKKYIFLLILYYVQCNLDLVTSNLATTCDLVTILQGPFFNLLHQIFRFSDIMQFSDSFGGDQKCH